MNPRKMHGKHGKHGMSGKNGVMSGDGMVMIWMNPSLPRKPPSAPESQQQQRAKQRRRCPSLLTHPLSLRFPRPRSERPILSPMMLLPPQCQSLQQSVPEHPRPCQHPKQRACHLPSLQQPPSAQQPPSVQHPPSVQPRPEMHWTRPSSTEWLHSQRRLTWDLTWRITRRTCAQPPLTWERGASMSTGPGFPVAFGGRLAAAIVMWEPSVSIVGAPVNPDWSVPWQLLRQLSLFLNKHKKTEQCFYFVFWK